MPEKDSVPPPSPSKRYNPLSAEHSSSVSRGYTRGDDDGLFKTKDSHHFHMQEAEEEEWQCKKCTLNNPYDIMECNACGEKRNKYDETADLAADFNNTTTVMEEEERRECNACTLIKNAGDSSTRCKACGRTGDKDENFTLSHSSSYERNENTTVKQDLFILQDGYDVNDIEVDQKLSSQPMSDSTTTVPCRRMDEASSYSSGTKQHQTLPLTQENHQAYDGMSNITNENTEESSGNRNNNDAEKESRTPLDPSDVGQPEGPFPGRLKCSFPPTTTTTTTTTTGDHKSRSTTEDEIPIGNAVKNEHSAPKKNVVTSEGYGNDNTTKKESRTLLDPASDVVSIRSAGENQQQQEDYYEKNNVFNNKEKGEGEKMNTIIMRPHIVQPEEPCPGRFKSSFPPPRTTTTTTTTTTGDHKSQFFTEDDEIPIGNEVKDEKHSEPTKKEITLEEGYGNDNTAKKESGGTATLDPSSDDVSKRSGNKQQQEDYYEKKNVFNNKEKGEKMNAIIMRPHIIQPEEPCPGRFRSSFPPRTRTDKKKSPSSPRGKDDAIIDMTLGHDVPEEFNTPNYQELEGGGIENNMPEATVVSTNHRETNERGTGSNFDENIPLAHVSLIPVEDADSAGVGKGDNNAQEAHDEESDVVDRETENRFVQKKRMMRRKLCLMFGMMSCLLIIAGIVIGSILVTKRIFQQEQIMLRLESIAMGVSGRDVFENTASAQYQALKWLMNQLEKLDNADEEEQRIIQMYILSVLFFSTRGENWNNQYHFLGDEHECEWTTCNNDNVVTELNLASNNLQGTIPTELAVLDKLTIMDLADNSLQGTIPSEVGSLHELTYLGLWSNNLTGTIPTGVGSIHNLTYLKLDSNKLTGQIPNEIGNLENLKWLYLRGNQLTGSIPSYFVRLSSVRRIWLDGNNLTGSADDICDALLDNNRTTGFDFDVDMNKMQCKCCTCCS